MKSYQIWGKLAREQKSYRRKTHWGMQNTPVLIGLIWFIVPHYWAASAGSEKWQLENQLAKFDSVKRLIVENFDY